MATKMLLREVMPYVLLYRCVRTGIAWVEDGRSGNGHSAHPNISASGSIRGMKSLGYWDKEDQTIRSHGFIYNISKRVVSDDLDQIAENNCRCGGTHLREQFT